MRVTQSMLSSNFSKNLSNSYEKLATYQNQLSTGKKITKPSEDPVVAMKGMAYRQKVQEADQYKDNFTEAYNWLDNTDSALDQATQAMQRVRELTVEASNGTYTDSERADAASEIEQLKEQIADIANTKVGNKYIFNGTDTTSKPVDTSTTPATVSTNKNDVNIELSKGIYVKVNNTASQTFSSDLFSELDKLVSDLKSSNPSDLSGHLDKLDTIANNIVNDRATVGARENRVQLMEDRVTTQQTSAISMMSKNEDADIDKVIVDLTAQESVQRAALSVGAQIIQPTLVDFLK